MSILAPASIAGALYLYLNFDPKWWFIALMVLVVLHYWRDVREETE